MFPIKKYRYYIPRSDKPGGFGFSRKHDVHTGIDLYCEEGTEVHAIVSGKVVNTGRFTGKDVGSSWWNDTDFIMIESEYSYGNILYGEIEIREDIKIGDEIKTGEIIGKVKQVLKNDKGLPMSMLHIEEYDNIIEPVTWYNDNPRPI